MAYQYKKLKCEVCNKVESFNDAKDITSNHWTILAWDVGTNTPRIVCSKCVYPVNKITKKELI